MTPQLLWEAFSHPVITACRLYVHISIHGLIYTAESTRLFRALYATPLTDLLILTPQLLWEAFSHPVITACRLYVHISIHGLIYTAESTRLFRALYATPLTYLLILTPQLLWEAFSHPVITACRLSVHISIHGLIYTAESTRLFRQAREER